MKDEAPSHARGYVARLAASGRHHFTSADAQAALGISAAAAKLALNRLAKQGLIASPGRGFYVIVPPEYSSLRSLPADQFIPALMQQLGLSYYVGLLSAAQYHGAAHHRPQQFQVMLAKARRPIVSGAVRVTFIVRKRLDDVPIQTLNTSRGMILVSTPEATAIDLVGYPQHTGGLDNVATVLSELAEQLDAVKLAAVAQTAPIPWVQRLGYLLDHVGAGEKASELKTYVRRLATQSVPLLPTSPHKKGCRDRAWKLYVNAKVDLEA